MRAGGPPVGLGFDLPEGRIARLPAAKREEARMFVCDRASGSRTHARVGAIGSWLRPGDLLVLNRARVDPARLLWRDPKGREQELVLLRPLSEGDGTSRWEAIVSGRNLPPFEPHPLPGERTFRKLGEGSPATIEISGSIEEVRAWMEERGLPPLPPYIRKERERFHERKDLPVDRERYQTTFAREGGAVAAPTAGLHFSADLLRSLRTSGIETAELHLSVGWGTFQPMTEEIWRAGRLHPEEVTVPEETAVAVGRALRERRRVVAVGTTVVRSLEWWHLLGRPEGGLKGSCDLFLRSPWRPEVVGALLTNFHLPHSSLLALVAAFFGEQGEEKVLSCYREAIDSGYRFFSYGDCMLVL